MAIEWGRLAGGTANDLGSLYQAYVQGQEQGYDNDARKALAGNQPNFLQRIVGQISGQQPQAPQANPSFIQQIAAPQAPQNNTPQFAPPPQTNSMFADQPSVSTSPEPLRPQALAWAPEDRDRVIRTIWGEAGNQGPNGQAAVAAVIANRLKAGNFGKSPTEVVMAPNQFEPWGNPSARQRMMQLSPNSPEYQQIAAQLDRVLAGEDPTQGATHFYAPKAQAALNRAPPRWDNGTGFDIGDHRFFRLQNGPSGQQQANQQQLPPNAAPTQMQAPGVQGNAGIQFSQEQLQAMLRSKAYAPMAMQYLAQQRGQANSDRDYQFRQQEADRQQGNFQRTQERQDAQFRATQDAGSIKTIKNPDGSESLVRIDRQGNAVPINTPGSNQTPSNPFVTGTLNESQSKEAAYADRMAKAHLLLNNLETVNQGTGYLPGAIGNANIPFMGRIGDTTAFNTFSSADRQSLVQAQRAFINALLRRESGATIQPNEFDNYAREYFPSPGDDDKIIAQKRLARETALNGLMRGAGRGYTPPPDYLDHLQKNNRGPANQQRQQQNQVTEGSTATNPQTGQKIQFRNGQWVPAQ